MAGMLGAKLFIFDCPGSRIKRYVICSLLTFKTLFIERPDVVFCQNPSVILNVLLVSLRMVFKYRLVSDAHYAGIVASNSNRWLQIILDQCNKWADLVIVTTIDHFNHVVGVGGKAVVCEDPLPELSGDVDEMDVTENDILFICSFDIDEPYEQVFNAAELLDKDGLKLSVTGDYSRVRIDPLEYPFVSFLGYLSDTEYHRQLFKSSVVVDLTENENCLVCGAYEAMSAMKPLVTSNTASLKLYFTKGTIFCDHDVNSIYLAIKEAHANRQRLKLEIDEWKKKKIAEQDGQAMMIKKAISL